jgi:hypothetical protein
MATRGIEPKGTPTGQGGKAAMDGGGSPRGRRRSERRTREREPVNSLHRHQFFSNGDQGN